MNLKIYNDNNYKTWIIGLKEKIRVTQIKAALKVNTELLNLYWQLGQDIVEKQQQSNWGDALIDQLAMDLSSEFPEIKGFSRTNLFYIRRWFLFYNGQFEKVPQLVEQLQRLDPFQFVPQLVAQIPWGHNREIITKTADINEALFYVQETLRNNWSRSVLLAQIETGLYQRKGKSINNFEVTLPKPQADLARETLKNPYNFDFLTLGRVAKERDLESALTDQITKFLLELGQGFAYKGKQYHLNINGDDFYIDLLFYHTLLRCHVVVELKVSEFEPEFLGKLNFYLSAIDEQLRHNDDQPTIGILLCKTPNKVVVEYALRNITKPLGISEYQLTHAIPANIKGDLPTIEELEIELEKEIEFTLKPIDKKLRQMEELLSLLKEERIQQKRNENSASDIFFSVIIPLSALMEQKLKKLETHFNEIKIFYQIGNHTFNDLQSSKQFLIEKVIYDQLLITFQFDGFKPAGKNAFSVWTKLEIELRDYSYIVRKDKTKPIFIKLYHQKVSENELNELAEILFEETIDIVNNELGKLKNKL